MQNGNIPPFFGEDGIQQISLVTILKHATQGYKKL